VNSGGL
jgi:hypothetical protein